MFWGQQLSIPVKAPIGQYDGAPTMRLTKFQKKKGIAAQMTAKGISQRSG